MRISPAAAQKKKDQKLIDAAFNKASQVEDDYVEFEKNTPKST